MSQKIKVAAAALNQTALDWENNKRNILAALSVARAEGVSVLCLPELCISGYGCEDAFLSEGTQQTSLEILKELLPETKNLIAAIGLPLKVRGELYDASALCVNGELLGFECKKFLARDGIHYEPRWFREWKIGEAAEVELWGKKFLAGDLIFNFGAVTLGFEICEDAWVKERPCASLAAQGANIVLNPSASHFELGKQKIRRELIAPVCAKHDIVYVYANLLGNEAGRAIYDGSCFIAEPGKELFESARLGYSDVKLLTREVELPKKTVKDGTSKVVKSSFAFKASTSSSKNQKASWEDSKNLKEEEFARAVSLGLFDYMRKSRAKGFVISLSGGADSACVASLIYLMVKFSASELGLEAVSKKLGVGATSEKELVRNLLTCVYQSTENSSDTTRIAARKISEAIGAEFLELDVNSIVQSYEGMISKALNRELSWERDDLARQNIQARVRAPGVWLIANLKGALLLTTSNRSEAAVGYTTMDGDTAGGLNPIGGIDKAYILKWLKWFETEGTQNIGALPVLSVVTSQAPTAELKPKAEGKQIQKDEADLMPYAVLDVIERNFVRDKKQPKEILAELTKSFPEYSRDVLVSFIEKFFTLWSRNQWKRERYAPSFHLDDANLDPKTWCRFPILSGGFVRELRELRAILAR